MHVKSRIEPVFPLDALALKPLIEREFPYIKEPLEQLETRIQNPFFFLFKISNANHPAGFCEWEKIGEKTVRLNALAILPKERNNGFGKQLLEHSISFLKQNGFENASLLVKKQNAIARALY